MEDHDLVSWLIRRRDEKQGVSSRFVTFWRVAVRGERAVASWLHG